MMIPGVSSRTLTLHKLQEADLDLNNHCNKGSRGSTQFIQVTGDMVYEPSPNSVVPHMLRGGSDQTDRQGIFSRMWTYEGMVHTIGERSLKGHLRTEGKI
ncbi:unnamed protein product [Sphagnum jensenii]|jgi:hypothetical protein|uniref:Uncharacterized protein n=1 Tax=Sphagnum jensenii TaxID=128206 RepID=A0ABP0XA26_9BRYO